MDYSVQPSSLTNSSGDVLGRYQVSYSEPTVNFNLEQFPTSQVVESLAEGRPVNFTLDGTTYFQVLPSISGSTLFQTPETPLASNLGLGFRPSVRFLASVRSGATFNKVSTASRVPVVLVVNSMYLDEKATNSISINGGHSCWVEIVGTNLRLAGENITITLSVSDLPQDSVQLVTDKTEVITWTNSRISFLTKAYLVSPPQTGILSIVVDGKSTTFNINVIDRT